MAKISLAGFKDPVRRPRYIIWTGVAVLVLAAVMIVALGVTSTYWFCAEGCHKVQDDAIIAYERSSHSNVSCMACHMPPNANPIVFILHKAEALGELYLTVTDNFELPLNAHSHLALSMTSDQCTQCHNMANRRVTPSPGIKIDHEAHAEVNAACTVCHNRAGHREDFELTLRNPERQGGEPSRKHADFMSMTACFRCHSLTDSAAPSGACAECHTPEFDLKPANHDAEGFLPGGHAEMAAEAKAEVEAALHEGEEGAEGSEEATGTEGSEEGTGGGGSEETTEGEEQSLFATEKAYASGGAEIHPVPAEQVPEVIAAQRSHGADPHETIGPQLPSVESVFYCATCHVESTFCLGCHGVEMPHPAAFIEPASADDPAGHPVASRDEALAEKCVMCHGQNSETFFCDKCHHGTKVNHEFNTEDPWTASQHPKAVAASGISSCTTMCHAVKFCSDCHTGRNIVPSSHEQSGWTRTNTPTMTNFGTAPAAPSALHALEAQKSLESCGVCHGEGGMTADFCMDCHRMELPHPAEFKSNHVSSKNNQDVCANCHRWPELCSNCHHVGSSTSRPWMQVHGGSVNESGSQGCLQCHGGESGTDTAFCVDCHQDRNVVPASHRADRFVRDRSSNPAGHVELYQKDASLCIFCHAGEAATLPSTEFCNDCHKLPMPHPEGFGAAGQGNGGEHQRLFQANETTREVCENCHTPRMCDNCHHQGDTSADEPWVRYHDAVVKEKGATPCFECHEETYCSACHVNLAKRGLL